MLQYIHKSSWKEVNKNMSLAELKTIDRAREFIPAELFCPRCGEIMEVDYQNVGFSSLEGPSLVEVAGYYCTECGYEDEL